MKFQLPRKREPWVYYRHLGREWTITELAKRYGTDYRRMAEVVRNNPVIYVRVKERT